MTLSSCPCDKIITSKNEGIKFDSIATSYHKSKIATSNHTHEQPHIFKGVLAQQIMYD